MKEKKEKKVKLRVKKKLCYKVGIAIKQLNWDIDKNSDFVLCGSIKKDEEGFLNPNKYNLVLKLIFCDRNNNILWCTRCYQGINLLLGYDSFSIDVSKIDRYLDLKKLSNIELFPVFERREN